MQLLGPSNNVLYSISTDKTPNDEGVVYLPSAVSGVRKVVLRGSSVDTYIAEWDLYQLATVLNAANIENKVSLQWEPTLGADSYIVQRSLNPGGPYELIAEGVAGTSYIDTDVAIGTTYYYTIVPVNSTGTGLQSNEAHATPTDQIFEAPSNLIAIGDAEEVSIGLHWDGMDEAQSYKVMRSGNAGGPYATIAEAVYGTNYTDVLVNRNVPYFYVVTANYSDGVSPYSNEASALLEEQEVPFNSRALLIITMDTGLEKEYDLSMTEVNAFIEWFEAKEAGSGPATFAINKHNNNIGPFKNRKDYVIFGKIQGFEVNEYEVDTTQE